MTTLAELLARQLSRSPGRPLVTYYDDATGERVELSVATYANWVAKVSSLLDELGLERGMRILVDLPTHWLGTVVLGAAWNVGLVVTGSEGTDAPDAVVVGPDGVAAWDADRTVVLASALLPLGVRFADELPVGVHDLGVEVWSQPDSFAPWDPPTGADLAVDWGGLRHTQEQMWEAAAASECSGRLLSEANPASPPGLASFTEPLAGGGSVVLVAHAGPGRLEAIAGAERVTDRFPRGS